MTSSPAGESADLPKVTDLLPHRGRYLIVDRLLEVGPDSAVAEADFSVEDCDGHFPGNPVVPGVILLEGLAQTMGCLSQHLDNVEGEPMLAGFDKVRFRAPVRPPATVTFKVKVTERRFGLTRGTGTVYLDGKRVVTARLTGAFFDPNSES